MVVLGAAAGALMLMVDVGSLWLLERAGVELGTTNPFLLFEELEFSSNQSLTLVLFIVVVTPLAEELFFRGYLYRLLRARYTLFAAAALSSGLFALVHWEPTLFVPLLAAGVILALLYEWTGSLTAPIVAHMLSNAAAMAATFYLLEPPPF